MLLVISVPIKLTMHRRVITDCQYAEIYDGLICVKLWIHEQGPLPEWG